MSITCWVTGFYHPMNGQKALLSKVEAGITYLLLPCEGNVRIAINVHRIRTGAVENVLSSGALDHDGLVVAMVGS